MRTTRDTRFKVIGIQVKCNREKGHDSKVKMVAGQVERIHRCPESGKILLSRPMFWEFGVDIVTNLHSLPKVKRRSELDTRVKGSESNN